MREESLDKALENASLKTVYRNRAQICLFPVKTFEQIFLEPRARQKVVNNPCIVEAYTFVR